MLSRTTCSCCIHVVSKVIEYIASRSLSRSLADQLSSTLQPDSIQCKYSPIMGALRPTQTLLFRVTPLAQLKLLALPLTTPRSATDSPPAFLLHAKRTPPANIDLKNADGSKKDLPYVTRATVWAADQWAKLGQAEENTWKRKAFVSTSSTEAVPKVPRAAPSFFELCRHRPKSQCTLDIRIHPICLVPDYLHTDASLLHRKWEIASWIGSSLR